jgi:ankyrin repeat protein
MLAWLVTGVALLLAATAILRVCHERQRRHEAARIVRAIADKDQMELLLLLIERVDLHWVAEWFGEPALIIAVKSFAAGSENGDFPREAVRLLISHGAEINEPGTEWKTALMHAAGNGDWELCSLLLSYGADAAAGDMFGRTAAYWAEDNGHDRTASLLRKVDA